MSSASNKGGGPIRLTSRVGLALALGGACQIVWWCSKCILVLCTMTADQMHFDFLTFETDTAHTSGKLTGTAKEAIQRQGQDDLVTYSYSFEYDVAGHTLNGRAYSEQSLDQDSVVDVEYVVAAPRNARIVGTTTRQTSGTILVIGAALLFACIAWMLWRIAGLQVRSNLIRDHIESQAPDATWGWLPKLRMNQYGEVTTKGAAWLLLAPIISIALLAATMILVEA